ncbi:MAG: FGGY family carbohydrate kinase [Clostridia bacterium]|nr:FGGY family carbohydrate kinase [Clostridia bacterium]
MYAVGIDIGTTGICGILMNSETGEIEKTLSADNDSFIKSDFSWEKIQDADVILGKATDILDALLDIAEVKTIGISNQMHGIVYTDSDGNAVSPLYIWQDERGNLSYRDGESYAQHLGSFAGYGLVTDFYNRENGLVPKNAVYTCTIGDLFAMRLCSSAKPVMHITNAASFGCFDIFKNRFTIDNGMLPDVSEKFVSVGEYKGAQVICAVGDNQASFIGSVDGDMPLINVGTGSQISYLSSKAVSAENIETRPFCDGKYLIVGSSLCGGRAFAMLERFFASVVEMATGDKCGSLYPQMDKLLAAKLSTDMKADTRFCGTRADPSVRGSFTNVSQDNFTAGDMTVAVLYAIANELHDMYSGGETDYAVCSGNGIRKNPALQRIAAQVFGAKIKIPLYKEEAAYGAALTALYGCGEFASLDEARKLIIYS